MDPYLYIVLKMVYINDHNEIITKQVSLIVGSNFLISLQEKEGGVFNPIRVGIKDAKG
jgi:magnesium transporter